MLLSRLKVKFKTGRPVNVHKNMAGEAALKNCLPLMAHYGTGTYFTDEMRYSTRTRSRRWQGRRV